AGFVIPSLGVLVDHDHQGLGIGRALTAHAIARAREIGCPAVRLSVYESNPVALALYQSLGFVHQSAEPTCPGADGRIVMIRAFVRPAG
ncbi:MAG: GNAT family N-acetyltransferase, partial [Actinomycetota bacterium]|nr:GNAT family N-acetyltransferase [Actinomycetota bacterium]